MDGWGRWLRSPVAQALVPALLVSWLYWLSQPALRTLPGVAPGHQALPAGADLLVVPQDVLLAGHAVGGWRLDEVRRLLEEWAPALRQEPVPAALDPATRGRVPHLNGLELDVEATLERLRAAAAGERVSPVYREIPAPVRTDQLPPAPVYRGNPARHAAALAINVGWGEPFLPAMLRTLEAQGVKATFFLVGEWVEEHPREALAIAAAGHEIASHGHSPAAFDQLTPDQAAEELRRAEEAIRAVTGRKPRLFSPHRGAFNPALLQAAAAHGYQTVLWTVDTVDWAQPGVEAMLERVLREAHPGAIVLLHPTAQSAEALEPMIRGLRRRGLRLVPVGTLLSPSPLAH